MSKKPDTKTIERLAGHIDSSIDRLDKNQESKNTFGDEFVSFILTPLQNILEKNYTRDGKPKEKGDKSTEDVISGRAYLELMFKKAVKALDIANNHAFVYVTNRLLNYIDNSRSVNYQKYKYLRSQVLTVWRYEYARDSRTWGMVILEETKYYLAFIKNVVYLLESENSKSKPDLLNDFKG